MKWHIILSKQAAKDAQKLARAGLKPQVAELLQVLQDDPFQNPPAYEKLLGNLAGFYSRWINVQHRLVYRVEKDRRIVHILRMWTHYE